MAGLIADSSLTEGKAEFVIERELKHLNLFLLRLLFWLLFRLLLFVTGPHTHA